MAAGSRDQTCPRCLLELALKDPSESTDQTVQTSRPSRDLPERIGPYRILELLGEGGMGQVYLAEDTSLERQVALKFLPQEMQADETARKRFQREAKSAAALDHPFICHIHEIGEAEGQGYIAMEYVQGETLREKLVSGPLPVKQALQVASEIAEALEKAHQTGIVHRDLKPSNIMITPEGHVKVMDFGLAKRVVSDPARTGEAQLTTLTKEGSTLGTVPYMSPEQLKGQEVDTRSDIFSFGIILYEMLAGVHPFLRAEVMETAGAILNQDPSPLARYREEVSELLQHTVRKMLAKDRNQRYQAIHEVRRNLTELAGPEIRIPEESAAEGQRRSLQWVGVAVLLMLVLTVLWAQGLFLTTDSPKTPQLVNVRRFTSLPGPETQPTWSPDGKFVAFVYQSSGKKDIWVQAVSGGEPAQITHGPGDDYDPDWSPDGSKIVFHSSRTNGGLFTIPAPLGGDELRINDFGNLHAGPQTGHVFFSN